MDYYLRNDNETFTELVTEGAGFDRARLNAMLDDLAASTEPEIPSRPQAMCYSVRLPQSNSSFEYICKTCGTHTFYKRDWRHMDDELAECHAGVRALRAMGLDISLDESPLCCNCRSAKELDLPTRCMIIKADETKSVPWYKRLVKHEPNVKGFKVGEVVAIKTYSSNRDCYYVEPLHPDYWIKAADITDTGLVEYGGDLYCQPRVDKNIHAWVSGGTVLTRIPAKPGDPKGWVHVEEPPKSSPLDHLSGYSISVSKEFVGNFSYEEPEPLEDRLGMVAWVINGRRIEVSPGDIDKMQSFLKGDKLRRPSGGDAYPLKKDLSRLRELFGTGVDI